MIIKEGIVNIYKQQIILSYYKEPKVETLNGKRILYIRALDPIYTITEQLKDPGVIGIYTEVQESDYNKIQQTISNIHSGNRNKLKNERRS